MNVILQSVYAGNVNYYAAFLKADEVLIDVNEHFLKQSYRNRCVIAGANGPLNLIVSVKRKTGRIKLKDVEIDYSENWQNHLQDHSIDRRFGRFESKLQVLSPHRA